MSRPIKVLALAIGDGINLILNFLLIPILARTFNIETYGTYGQVLMLVGFFVTLLSMGLNNILLRDLSQTERKSEVFYNNLFSGLLLGTLGMLLVLLCAPLAASQFKNTSLLIALQVYSPYIPFTIAINSCNAALIYLGKSKSIVSISILSNVIRLGGIIFISIFQGQNLNLIFGFLTLLSGAQFFILWKQVAWDYQPGLVSKPKIFEQIRTALPLGITVMISSVLTVTDGIYVSSLLNVEDYAVYRNGAMYLPLIMNLYGAINSIILPDISLLYKENRWHEIVLMKQKIAGIFVFFVYPVLIYFLVFAVDLITLIYSEKYLLSTFIFQVFNITLFFRICNAEDLFLVANKAGKLPLLYGITCLYALVLNYFLIHEWGINGAVWVSFSATLLLMTMVYTLGFRLINVRFRDIVPWKEMAKVALITLPLNLILWTGKYVFHHPGYFLIVFIPYLILCYYMILKFGWMSSEFVRQVLLAVIGNGRIVKTYDYFFS